MNGVATSAESEALLTAKEVAALFKASESLVYRLQREGRLPAVRIGWLLRFHPETVRAFMRGEPRQLHRIRGDHQEGR